MAEPPTTHELTRMTAIAAVFCGVALAAAFAGGGITAFAVLAIVVGPASVLLYRAFSNQRVGGASSTDAAGQPYPR